MLPCAWQDQEGHARVLSSSLCFSFASQKVRQLRIHDICEVDQQIWIVHSGDPAHVFYLTEHSASLDPLQFLGRQLIKIVSNYVISCCQARQH